MRASPPTPSIVRRRASWSSVRGAALAEISRYGAYLPKYRVPLGEVQKFFGRPGRPRSKTLSIPALDEDALTMAYEAADQALGEDRAPGAILAVSMSPP